MEDRDRDRGRDGDRNSRYMDGGNDRIEWYTSECWKARDWNASAELPRRHMAFLLHIAAALCCAHLVLLPGSCPCGLVVKRAEEKEEEDWLMRSYTCAIS